MVAIVQSIRFVLVVFGVFIFSIGIYGVATGAGVALPSITVGPGWLGFAAEGVSSGAIVAILGLILIFVAAQFMKIERTTRAIVETGSANSPSDAQWPFGAHPTSPNAPPQRTINEVKIKAEGKHP